MKSVELAFPHFACPKDLIEIVDIPCRSDLGGEMVGVIG